VNAVITISDPAAGSSAKILPGVGFNCFSFVSEVGGRQIDALYADPSFGARSELSLHGIPLLFPFAGRIAGGTYAYEGVDYRITGAALVFDGNTAHGFVISRPWRVIRQSEDEVVGEFQASIDDPSLLDQWPADFKIQVGYRVVGNRLISEITLENPDQLPLPCGFGTHPYFRLPDDPEAAAEAKIVVPANKIWTHVDLLPTGEIEDVSGDSDMRDGVPFSTLAFDGVLTGLNEDADGTVHTGVISERAGYLIEQRFDPRFRNCVVYTPQARTSVAIEPWTTTPNAFALIEQGIDPDLMVLQPGETWSTTIEIEVKPV
jgi:aldose 1-epimerase